MSNSLLVEEIGSSIIIRFNRPDIRSPLSIAVLKNVSRIIDDIELRENAERVIFTGVGNVFASGADLREIARTDSEGARAFALRGQQLMQRISALNATTIAAINGICFGGALDLALACDRRFASPGATFSHPGANLGIITGWGGTQRLPRLIGVARALEMLFTARPVTADDALGFGLIDRISEDVVKESLVTCFESES
jgi:enoyl-CoA hydratase